jgi:hypothetical protein
VATETIVTRVCDMPHREEVPASTFELYSRVTGRYEVDLCEGCAAKIFAPAVANGRKVTNRKK